MAKKKGKKIEERVKKVVPDNQWLVNVTKSLGFTTLDVVQSLLPDTADTVDWNKDSIIKPIDMIKNIRNNNGLRNSFNKQFGNIPQIKAAGLIKKNAWEDFKSGNWNNKARENGMDDDGDFGFGDDFDFGDDGPQFIDDGGSFDDSSEDSGGESSRPPITVINTMPLAKTLAASTEATVGTMTAIADQQMAVETEKLMFNQRSSESMLNALGSINDNLALLVQFNSDSTAKFQAAALKYYEQSLELMKPDEKEPFKEGLNPFLSGGGLKLDEYLKVIKKNLEDIKDDNPMIGNIVDQFLNVDVITGFAKNPIGQMMTMVAQGVVPELIKKSLSEFDKNLNSILPAVLARINTFEDSDDPLLNSLNKVFGYKAKASHSIDLSKYEKGPIPWDGESKKALVEVIPTYLRRIESAVTGTEERYYNYSTGKFTDYDTLKTDHEKSIKRAETYGYTNVSSKLYDIAKNMDLTTPELKQFEKDIEEYLSEMTNKGSLISHIPRLNSQGEIVDEFVDRQMFEGDPARIAFMKKALSGLSEAELVEMATVGITDSRNELRRVIENMRANPTSSGYAYLKNDGIDYKNGRLKYDGKRPGMRDEYGLSQLDYLRDIRSALINGIKVFPDYSKNRPESSEPNENLLFKEREENEKVEKRRKRQEDKEKNKNKIISGTRTIKEASQLGEIDWNAAYGIDPFESNEPDLDTKRGKVQHALNDVNKKLEGKLFEILYGDEDYAKRAIEKLSKHYKKGKSMVETMKGFFSDTVKSFKSYFTGQGYTTSDGVYVEGNENNILSKIRDVFVGFKDKLTQGKDGEEGFLQRFTTDFMNGYEKFKVSLFGEKALGDFKGKETFQDLMDKVKQRLPKALGHGVAAAMIKTTFASHLGLLGSFLMPGGPLGAALMGTTFGFLRQSETFNRYMFGELDDNGNRLGGFISREWQEKYKEYAPALKKSAGLGLLASFFLPGGPLMGAIMGIGTGLAVKNEAFQKFLFGDNYLTDEKKSLANGVFGRTFKRIAGEDADPGLAKFLGTAGLGIGLAQGVGLLPSFLLPGGPIMGAMLGLAGGITASSDKFQEFLLGEKDIDGKRYGGLLTKAANWFNTSFVTPLKIKATEMSDRLYGFMRKNLLDPIARTFEPLAYALKNMVLDIKDGIVDAFTEITSPIVEAFKDWVIKPLGKALKKVIINPIKKVLKTTFSLLTKGLLGLIGMPIRGAIGGIGAIAEKYNERSTIRREERRRRKEYDKNTAKEDWNWHDRKAAQKMTKKEKKELLDEKLKYRDGKTRRQRKREQKGDFKDDMQKRKERLQKMKDQYEEDKKFAKESGFKYASKRQKEKREQELKEKQAWYQQQQLMKAQDTDEKVEMIKDNVIQFPEQNTRVVTKLDEVKNTLKEGFDKLAGKFGFSNDDSDYGQVTDEHMATIYDFLDEKEKRRPSETIEPVKDYGKVTDEHLDKIHDYINKPEEEKQPTTLKDAFEDFKGEVKDLVKTIRDNKKNKNDDDPDPNKPRKRIIKNEKKDSKVIDINKYLKDNDQSHEDGLDKVPADGYIAELHKDEMVVPKKPAGKLRKMMNRAGKGFSGLTDVLAEVSEDDRRDRADNALGLSDAEADRAKELEDRERRENILQRTKNKIKEHMPTEDQVFEYIAERPVLRNLTIKGLTGTSIALQGVANGARTLHDKVENGADKVLGGMHKAINIASMIGSGTPISSIVSMFGRNNQAAEGREAEDDALGLTDHQEDQMKEIEDRERYEHASRKDVDFVRGQIAAKDKEKEEKKWKENLLDTVKNIGQHAASAGLSLFDLLSKGFDMLKNGLGNIFSGLGSLALPAAIAAGVYSWNQYKKSDEYIEGRTDIDADGDGEGDFIYDNTDANIVRGYISAREKLIFKPARTLKKKFIDPVVEGGKKAYKGVKNTGKKLYDSKVGQKFIKPIKEKYTAKMNKGKEFLFGKKTTPDNVVDFAKSKAAKNATQSGSGKAVNKAIQGGTDNVVDFAQKKAAKEATQAGTNKVIKEATEAGSGKAVKKLVGETVEGVADSKGLFNKMIDMAKTAISAIGTKLSERYPGLVGKMSKLSDDLLELVIRHSDGIIKKFAKKIGTWIGRVAAGTSTAFVLDAVFGVCDLVSGATAGNAGNLFGVAPQNVDLKMRIISSVLQVVTNFNVLGVIGLINEITSAMFNLNFIRMLAIGIYNLISDDASDLRMRIKASQIDSCKSIDEALSIMGITDPKDIAQLKDGNDWKNFTECKNEELGGVISPTEQMELARLQYNLANGTKLSSQAYVDKESKTLGSKMWEGTKKLFKSETAQQKINKLNTKAETDREQAAGYRQKAKESNNIFGKAWNNSMAWLNEKQAEKREKKAQEKKVKANKKKAKAESKAAYHEEKAANSTGISKWYHDWRAKKNKKKVEKYTLDEENGKVVTETETIGEGTVNTTPDSEDYMPKQIMTPEQVLSQYDIPEGKTITDINGNTYDSNGNYLGDAGMGDGELENQVVIPHEYKDSKEKKSGLLSKTMKAFLRATPGGAALSTLFGRNKKAKDYRMVPIMDENGNIVSYQSKLIKDTTEIEGFGIDSSKMAKKAKENELIPQYDEKGNVVGTNVVKKNKSKGFFGKLASGIGSLFGFGSTTNNTTGGSVDNSVTTTTSGDTYNTTTNSIDTTPFGPLTDAINSLVGTYGSNNVDEEGNVKTGGVLTAIMDPLGYLGKKLTSVGVNVYEMTTGKEADPEKINEAITWFNIIRNPLGYFTSQVTKLGWDGAVEDVKDKGKVAKDAAGKAWDVTKDAAGKAWNTTKDAAGKAWDKTSTFVGKNLQTSNKILNKAYHTVADPITDYAKWVGGEFKEFGDNPWAYTLNSAADLNRNIYFGAKDKVTKVKDFAADKINKVGGWVDDKFGDKISSAKNKVGNFMSDKFGFVTEGVNSDNSLGYNIGRVAGNIFDEIDDRKDKMVESVKTTVKEAIDKIGETFTWLKDEFPKKIQEGLKKVTDFLWYEVPEKIGAGFKFLGDKIGEGIDWIKTEIPKKIGEGIDWAKEKVDEAVKWVTVEVPKKIGEIKDKVVDGFKKMWKTVTDAVTEKVEDMKSTFSKENIKKVFTEKVEEVKKAWGNFTDSFGDIFDDIKSHIKLPDITFSVSEIKSFFGDMFKGFKAGVEDDDEKPRSGPKPHEYLTANKIKPVQHNISSNELLKPMNTTNNTTTNKTNNKFVFYNQSDARWGNEKIGNRNMKDAGCGPTSLAMAVSQLTGEQITPDTIAKLGQEHLPGYSQYSLFPSIADKLDMNYTEGKDPRFITRNLKQGVPVILSGRTNSSGTPYTSEGHVVTASHIKGNMVYIQDPRGEQYSKYYPINSLMVGLTKGMILTPSNQTDVSGLSSGLPTELNVDPIFGKQELGLYGDVGEYQGINESDENLGRTGAGQIKLADRVLSYAKAFLQNTSKFSYSQPRRLQIDNNKGNGADCSSFVSHVLSRAGDVNIYGNTSTTLWNNIGTKVSEPQIGDVVCQVGHVGVYSGNGNYIHMSGRKSGIKESKAIQNGNNKHRGYKRVLKNPNQMVDPTVPNPNKLLGTVVGTSSGNPVGGGSSDTTGGDTSTANTVVPQVDPMGVFGELNKIGNNLLASIYNGKQVDLYATPVADTSGGTNSDGSSGGTNPDISGISDTATAIWKFFTGKGYSTHATAGIMGNLKQESGLNPSSKQSGGGPGRGIAQWTVGSGRFKGLEAHAKSKGKEWTDLQSQLEWIDLELGGKDSTTASKLNKSYGGLEGLKKATDYKWAVEAFEKSFERAGKPNYPRRYQYAQEFYNKLASAGAGPATATSAEAAPASGIPDSMNGWKYYQQSDPKWAGQVGSSTVSRGGCGPTSAAMMLSTIFGKQINPLTMTKWAHSNGTWTGAMQWTMPGKVASTFGLNMTDLGSNANGVSAGVLDKVKESLKAGKPVMLTGRGTGASGSAARTDTPFTPGGHVVLAVGVDGSGNVIINDPRGASRSKAYTDAGILDVGVGLRGAWAFDTSGGKIPDNMATDGDFTGGTSNGGGGTTGGGGATVEQTDPMGVFGQLNKVGNNLLASIFNGKQVDLYAAQTSSDSSGGTSGGSLPVGDTTVDETLMLSGQEGFFKALGPSAAAAFNQYHIFPSTTLAQAALESAWGKSRVAKSDKNLFGIKWTGNHAPGINVTKGLNCPGNEQGGARPYNRYASYADSMTDHGWFLDKYDRYNSALAASTPEEQIRLLGKSGYAEASTYGSSLQKMVDKYDLTKYNSSAGAGDGKIHMVTPKGDAGMGDGKINYSKSVTEHSGTNKIDANAQRNIEAINRKINVAFNNINASDPNAYAEILKIILQELQAINSNTAATASGVQNIEIVSASTPVESSYSNTTTADKYNHATRKNSDLRRINSSTGYDMARQIAGYKK